MKTRIKKIIETSGIKKTEFARKINVSPPFVSELCSGAKSPSDRTIADICRVFGVSEHWLRTGEGEMFKKISETEELEQIFAAISTSNDEFIKRIIRAYWRLTDSEKAGVRELIDRLASEARQASELPSAEPEVAALIPEGSSPEIEDRISRYRQHLIAKAKAKHAEKHPAKEMTLSEMQIELARQYSLEQDTADESSDSGLGNSNMATG